MSELKNEVLGNGELHHGINSNKEPMNGHVTKDDYLLLLERQIEALDENQSR